jgi:hypothetical protein
MKLDGRDVKLFTKRFHQPNLSQQVTTFGVKAFGVDVVRGFREFITLKI